MDIRPISEALNTSPFEVFKQRWKDALEKDWYFEGLWQKLFVTGCVLYTIFSIAFHIWRAII